MWCVFSWFNLSDLRFTVHLFFRHLLQHCGLSGRSVLCGGKVCTFSYVLPASLFIWTASIPKIRCSQRISTCARKVLHCDCVHHLHLQFHYCVFVMFWLGWFVWCWLVFGPARSSIVEMRRSQRTKENEVYSFNRTIDDFEKNCWFWRPVSIQSFTLFDQVLELV